MITEATSLKKALENKATITTLNLKGSRLEKVPEEIKELTNLRSLWLQNNRLTSLPDWLEEMKNLEYIYAENNYIQKFGLLPPNLKILNIERNRLLELPRSFCKLQKIHSLNLNDNQLSELPEGFKNVLDENLNSIDLSSNQFTTFPKLFCQFKQLRVVNFNYNKITSLPAEVGNWTRLEKAQFANNALTKLPKSIGNWKLLSELHVSSNQLKELPDNITKCVHLRGLKVGSNQLTTLPNLENMAWLSDLYISNNQLSSFGFDIGKLSSLKWLFMRNNQFTELPDVFNQFPNLYDVHINDNPLTKLPPTLLHKENMHMLSIGNLQLKKVPLRALFIPNLKYLYAKGNGLDEKILDQRKTFVKAVDTKNSSWSDVKIFYNIATQTDNPNNYPLTTFFKALSFSFLMTQNNALNYIRKDWEKKLKDSPLQKGSSIVSLGKTSFKKNEVKKKLKEWGIKMTPKINDQTTHVILEKGVKQYDGVDKEGLIFIPEQALQDFINENETLYLNEETTPQEEVDNIKALLLSVENDMVAVGVEMMTNLGVPSDCMEALLLVFKNTYHSTAVRNKAKKLLLLHGDAQLKSNIEKYKSANIISKKVHGYIQRDIKCLIKNTTLDSVTLAEHLYFHHDFDIQILLGITNDDDYQERLLKRFLERDPYLSINISFFKEPKRLFKLPIKNLIVSSWGWGLDDQFPQEFFQLTQLEKLSIEIRGLKEIPTELTKLTKLHTLSLNYNKIREFPTIFNEMKNLKHIYLGNSPFAKLKRQTPSKEIFDLSEHPKKITRK